MRKIIAYFKDLLYINFDGSLKFFDEVVIQ